MKKKNRIILLVFLIVLLIAVNYSFLDSKLEGFLVGERIEYVQVTRIVDGDTIKVNGNDTIRLLGINTPERGENIIQKQRNF